MNRRTFLESSLTGAALLSGPGFFRAADTSVARPRIPIGFLGATYSHGADKIKLTMTSPDWDFVGACDRTEPGRALCGTLGAKLISQEELFQRARVVAVESDVRDHTRHALLALNAGRHVHLEKPP